MYPSQDPGAWGVCHAFIASAKILEHEGRIDNNNNNNNNSPT